MLGGDAASGVGHIGLTNETPRLHGPIDTPDRRNKQV
jgi:hypothetical protein